MLYLVEDFYSIQGEGKFAGTPSIFLRFGGCNLRCPGFGEHFVKDKIARGCDSIHAVSRELFGAEWRGVTLEDLKGIVEDHIEHLDFKPHIVITGGEPLIYWNDPTFSSFIEYLVEEEFIVTVETNGTIEIDFDSYPAYRALIYALAVKLSNSGEPYEKRINRKAIRKIVEGGAYTFFKFTLSKNLIDFRADEEIFDIVAPYPDLEVFCMPLGERVEELRKHDRAVAHFCMIHGFIYSDRLQVRLWNRERRR
ncbi:MAG: 7-carboxy-7-deazaguanine synthase QueE [Epsilonproteobacteria bacterium]|nr:7-carboxy-7-deazaguanine synthase QueE [Campylobacterota bacterium]NPA56773.1 7-carboxy-7-deazaguanine synthase QueE [Campylobacterota bacterium]